MAIKRIYPLIASILIFSGCQSENKPNEQQIAQNESIAEDSLNITIEDKKELLELAWNSNEVESFVKSFYGSLELSDSLNQQHYIEGNIDFDLSQFNSLLSDSSKILDERIKSLSGGYHDRYYIEFQKIDSIRFEDQKAFVECEVLYGLYECGNFYNVEKLVLNKVKNEIKVLEWQDMYLTKMELSPIGPENWKEHDFYEFIGQ